MVCEKQNLEGCNSNFILSLSRTGLVGCGMPVYCTIDHKEKKKLLAFKTMEMELPRKDIVVELHMPMLLGARIQKEILISPRENTAKVNLSFSMTMNYFNMIPPMCFFFPACKFIVQQEYI